MNQASDMLVIQSLAFFGKKLLFLEKNFKNDNFLNGIKTKQDKIKNSNIVEKMQFDKHPKSKKFALKLQLNTDYSNFDKRYSDAHFVSFSFYYCCEQFLTCKIKSIIVF